MTCFLILSSDDACSGDDIGTFSSNAGKAIAKRMPCTCSAQPSTPLPHEQCFGSLDASAGNWQAWGGHHVCSLLAQVMLIWLSLLRAGMMIKQAYVIIICIKVCMSGRLWYSIAYYASQLGHIKVVKALLAHGAYACLRSHEIQALHLLLCMLFFVWIRWSVPEMHYSAKLGKLSGSVCT